MPLAAKLRQPAEPTTSPEADKLKFAVDAVQAALRQERYSPPDVSSQVYERRLRDEASTLVVELYVRARLAEVL